MPKVLSESANNFPVHKSFISHRICMNRFLVSSKSFFSSPTEPWSKSFWQILNTKMEKVRKYKKSIEN